MYNLKVLTTALAVLFVTPALAHGRSYRSGQRKWIGAHLQ